MSKFFGLVALICAAGCVALIALAPQMPAEVVPLALQSAVWTAWVTVAVVTLLVAVALLRRLGRAIAPVFGDSIGPRLLSFGAVALVFTDTVQSLIASFVRFAVQLTVGMPGELQRVSTSTRDLSDPALKLEAFTSAMSLPFSELAGRLLYINYAWLFTALAAWAVLGQVLSSAMRVGATGPDDTPWAGLVQKLATLSPASWQNVILFAVITMGGLLSVSALITLPLLSQSNPLSQEEVKRIEGEFDAIVKLDAAASVSTTQFVVPDSLQKDIDGVKARVAELRDQQETAARLPKAQLGTTADANETSATPEHTIAALASIEQSMEQLVGTASTEWRNFQATTVGRIQASKKSALLAVRQQNYMPGGTGSEYVAQVTSWLNDTVSAAISSADFCRNRLLQSIEDQLEYSRSNLREIESGHVRLSSPSYGGRVYECFRGTTFRDQPDEQQLTLGAFGFSEWLIKLDSLPLTLIAGMLGFGLVGAAVSSVVRESKGREPGQPLVTDIVGVLVRGLSATIVVYLAVKGGLVIFTAGTAGEPDPHVLLLTCLIASVFSEDVWAAAKERFVNTVKRTAGGSPNPPSVATATASPSNAEKAGDAV